MRLAMARSATNLGHEPPRSRSTAPPRPHRSQPLPAALAPLPAAGRRARTACQPLLATPALDARCCPPRSPWLPAPESAAARRARTAAKPLPAALAPLPAAGRRACTAACCWPPRSRRCPLLPAAEPVAACARVRRCPLRSHRCSHRCQPLPAALAPLSAVARHARTAAGRCCPPRSYRSQAAGRRACTAACCWPPRSRRCPLLLAAEPVAACARVRRCPHRCPLLLAPALTSLPGRGRRIQSAVKVARATSGMTTATATFAAVFPAAVRKGPLHAVDRSVKVAEKVCRASVWIRGGQSRSASRPASGSPGWGRCLLPVRVGTRWQ